jgi:steroid 5-alpha reductase family enzyme
MIPLILGLGVALSVMMAAGWWFQRAMGNAGWVDVVWSFATGIAGVAGALWPAPGYEPRQILVAVLAGFWGVRLGLYLRSRVLTRPEDARYAGFRRDWGAAFQSRLFWFLQIQALAAWPLAIAITLAAHNPSAGFTLFDALGLMISAGAVAGAGIADRQLARFVADRANHGHVCDRGLWAWSRHPNYFFEFLGWCAWPWFAFAPGWYPGLAALLAPAMMYWLLVHVSGIPPLEAVMLASRGDKYRRYQARTSPFFPKPPNREVAP